MKIIRKIESLRKELKKKRNKTIGFVPTMGALHEGHLSLMGKARKENDLLVVSIFVNPIQFGPKEDLKKYPRNLKKDAQLCRKIGADIIFYPDAKEIYPEGHRTFISVEGLSDKLCGKSRPGHFKGVVTVVAKLFNIVNPEAAYFGQKDAQQAIIIKRMIKDLNIPVEIKVLPTVREIDGLAMSSRNAYLSGQERNDALVLHKSLKLAQAMIKSGQRDSSRIITRLRELINSKKSARIDYIAIVDTENLEPLKRINGEYLIILAVCIGRTRLIDNLKGKL